MRFCYAFCGLLDAIEACYSRGLPQFLADLRNEPLADATRQSAFRILDWSLFKSMSASDVQHILSTQAILLTNCPVPEYNSQVSLDLVGPRELFVEVQDEQTIHSVALDDVLNAAASNVPCKSNSLETLPVPRDGASVLPRSYASEVWAVQQTASEPFCDGGEPLFAVMQSYISSTEGARHYWRTESSGFATVIEILCGKELWVVARPKHFALFPPPSFDASKPNLDLWEVEATVLTPTIKVVQDPHRWHASWTMAHAVRSREHFLPAGALEKVSVGVMQTFLRSSVVTNAQDTEVWVLLQRIVLYFHMLIVKKVPHTTQDSGHYPDLQSIQSIRGLLGLLVTVELHNILCSSSYERADPSQYPGVPASQLRPISDINGLTHSQRQLRIYTRGVALDLLQYVSCNYRLVDSQDSEVKHIWRDVYIPVLAWTIFALSKLFPRTPDVVEPVADSKAGDLAYDIFSQQVRWSLDAFPGLQEAFGKIAGENPDMPELIWPGWYPLDIKTNPAPFPHTVKGDAELLTSGLRDGDRLHHLIQKAGLDSRNLKRSRSGSPTTSSPAVKKGRT